MRLREGWGLAQRKCRDLDPSTLSVGSLGTVKHTTEKRCGRSPRSVFCCRLQQSLRAKWVGTATSQGNQWEETDRRYVSVRVPVVNEHGQKPRIVRSPCIKEREWCSGVKAARPGSNANTHFPCSKGRSRLRRSRRSHQPGQQTPVLDEKSLDGDFGTCVRPALAKTCRGHLSVVAAPR
jgi:hypothetical protein